MLYLSYFVQKFVPSLARQKDFPMHSISMAHCCLREDITQIWQDACHIWKYYIIMCYKMLVILHIMIGFWSFLRKCHNTVIPPTGKHGTLTKPNDLTLAIAIIRTSSTNRALIDHTTFHIWHCTFSNFNISHWLFWNVELLTLALKFKHWHCEFVKFWHKHWTFDVVIWTFDIRDLKRMTFDTGPLYDGLINTVHVLVNMMYVFSQRWDRVMTSCIYLQVLMRTSTSNQYLLSLTWQKCW